MWLQLMVSAVSCMCSLLKPGLGEAQHRSVPPLLPVVLMLKACPVLWDMKGSREQGEQEHQPVHSPCSSPCTFEGAVDRNGSSKGILEVHRAFKGHLRYITLVWCIFVL